MTTEQLIGKLQELIEINENLRCADVRWEDGIGYFVNEVYVDADSEGDPVVVIY